MECDPNGLDQHDRGAKLDQGKPRVSLVFDFARALLSVAEVSTFGARKYCDGGWMQVEEGFKRYSDALGRHLLAERFEYLDKDSGLPHAAHAAWNALARLEFLLREKEKDNK